MHSTLLASLDDSLINGDGHERKRSKLVPVLIVAVVVLSLVIIGGVAAVFALGLHHRVTTSPLVPYDHLARLDHHLSALMDWHTSSGKRLLATFSSTPAPHGLSPRCPSGGYSPEYGAPVSEMADLYDNSVAAIYFLQRAQHHGGVGLAQRALDICDVLVLLEQRGVAQVCPQGGCTAASIVSHDIANFSTYIHGQQVFVGNLAWEALALMRCHAHSDDPKYLSSARALADWVLVNTWNNSGVGGFVMGDGGPQQPNLRYRRSTEHNIDAFAMFRMLSSATGNATYSRAMQHAQAFLQHMVAPQGHLLLGTLEDGVTVNTRQPVPTDAQSLSALARVPLARGSNHSHTPLDWVLSNTLISTTATHNTSQVLCGEGDDNEFWGAAFSSGKYMSMWDHSEHRGNVLSVHTLPTAVECGDRCLAQGDCGAASFDSLASTCTLHPLNITFAQSTRANSTFFQKWEAALGIQNEQSAMAGLAFADTYPVVTSLLLLGLRRMQQYAPVGGACTAASGTAGGIVATPDVLSADSGYGYCYPNAFHVASSAWTGLLLLQDIWGAEAANPFVYVPSQH